jgi:hypothetical protein
MRSLFLTIAALSLLACGGDSTGPTASAVGTWDLQTIDGSPLPFTIFELASPPDKLEVTSDTFVASSNGTYSETATLRETQGTTVTTQTQTDTGTWTQNNAAITLTSDSDGSSSSAAISGDVITASVSGDVFVFARR